MWIWVVVMCLSCFYTPFTAMQDVDRWLIGQSDLRPPLRGRCPQDLSLWGYLLGTKSGRTPTKHQGPFEITNPHVEICLSTHSPLDPRDPLFTDDKTCFPGRDVTFVMLFLTLVTLYRRHLNECLWMSLCSILSVLRMRACFLHRVIPHITEEIACGPLSFRLKSSTCSDVGARVCAAVRQMLGNVFWAVHLWWCLNKCSALCSSNVQNPVRIKFFFLFFCAVCCRNMSLAYLIS